VTIWTLKCPIPLVNAVHSRRLRASATKHEFCLTLTFHRLKDSLRSSKYATPATQAAVSKECDGRSHTVTVFNLDPIVDEVSALLSERDALDIRDDNGFLATVKFNRVLFHRKLASVPVRKDV
jgi:hypothetical protein